MATVIHPCEYVKEELEARGWGTTDFMKASGRGRQWCCKMKLVEGFMTLDDFDSLGKAFGTGPKLWDNLYESYLEALIQDITEEKAKGGTP